jgi:putative nucleotidyltransferase with HDIG domain
MFPTHQVLSVPSPHAVIRLVLVDDDPCVLRGLSRGLMMIDDSIEVLLCGSADECLKLLETANADAVVTDLHMPGKHGALLLEELRSRHPSVLRFVLSGEAKPDIFLNASNLALQCFSKPCDATKLHAVVTGALKEIRRIQDAQISLYISKLSSLPSSRELMTEISNMLADPGANLGQVSSLLQRDPSMVVRILKVANSAFFGHEGRVESIDEAISLLGMDSIINMVVAHRLFAASPPPLESHLNLEELWEHSARTATISHSIGPRMRMGPSAIREASTACLLHDLGKLIFACAAPGSFSAAQSRSKAENLPLWQCEYLIFKNNHAEVGATMLHLWGLPSSVVNAVADHHTPHHSGERTPGPVTLVHIADALAHQGDRVQFLVNVDSAHLKALQLPSSIADLQGFFA